MSAPIRFYDTTLRDGEQTVGVVLSPQQKLELARQIDSLGISRIEAGFPRVSAEDAEAIRLISARRFESGNMGIRARGRGADIDELVKLELKFTVIETPTSEIKLKAYGIARRSDPPRHRCGELRQEERNLRGVFPGRFHARRSEFLKSIYRATLDAGADEAVVVDTIGACGPEAVEFLVGQSARMAGTKNSGAFPRTQ